MKAPKDKWNVGDVAVLMTSVMRWERADRVQTTRVEDVVVTRVGTKYVDVRPVDPAAHEFYYMTNVPIGPYLHVTSQSMHDAEYTLHRDRATAEASIGHEVRRQHLLRTLPNHHLWNSRGLLTPAVVTEVARLLGIEFPETP